MVDFNLSHTCFSGHTSCSCYQQHPCFNPEYHDHELWITTLRHLCRQLHEERPTDRVTIRGRLLIYPKHTILYRQSGATYPQPRRCKRATGHDGGKGTRPLRAWVCRYHIQEVVGRDGQKERQHGKACSAKSDTGICDD